MKTTVNILLVLLSISVVSSAMVPPQLPTHTHRYMLMLTMDEQWTPHDANRIFYVPDVPKPLACIYKDQLENFMMHNFGTSKPFEKNDTVEDNNIAPFIHRFTKIAIRTAYLKHEHSNLSEAQRLDNAVTGRDMHRAFNSILACPHSKTFILTGSATPLITSEQWDTQWEALRAELNANVPSSNHPRASYQPGCSSFARKIRHNE